MQNIGPDTLALAYAHSLLFLSLVLHVVRACLRCISAACYEMRSDVEEGGLRAGLLNRNASPRSVFV